MKIHQQGTIYNAYQQSLPVMLDLDATDDGHLSGFANFHGGNLRPDGFPVGQKFSVITDDPRGGIVTAFIHLTIKFVHPQTAQVAGYIDGSRAQFQNVNTVANVQAEQNDARNCAGPSTDLERVLSEPGVLRPIRRSQLCTAPLAFALRADSHLRTVVQPLPDWY